MRRNAAFRRPVRHGVITVVLLVLSGCVTTPVPSEIPAEVPRPDPEPVPESAPDPIPEAEPGAEPRFDAARVLVVVDDARGKALEMLQVFSARLGRPYEILNLAYRTPASVARRLERAAPVDVIAIGPAAAAVAGGVSGLHVVQAAVFDPVVRRDSVDALPPFDLQLDYWQRVKPDLRRLGVIGSPRLSPRLASLAAACQARGLSLEQRTVESDQEMLLAFRALVPRIDGFVFLPDESVLSPEVIREVIAHGRRNNVQTLVYSPVMFNLGATLYVQPDPASVALSLIGLLEQRGTSVVVTEMQVRNRLNGSLALSSVPRPTAARREGIGY